MELKLKRKGFTFVSAFLLFFEIMGPTGIDSRCNASVSMPGVVGISRI